MSGQDPPKLSAILVVGPRRARSQGALDALFDQTAVDSMEIVVVDVAGDLPALKLREGVRTVYLSGTEVRGWAKARAAGALAATSPIVAFVEDHSVPEPDWAHFLIDAYRGPWAAVGYAFRSANPERYVLRSTFLARYGMFAYPAHSGPARYISGSNGSYRRADLLAIGPQNLDLLAVDFNVFEILHSRGLQMFTEGRAVVRHLDHPRLRDEFLTGRGYCRMMAADRVRANSWGVVRRTIYGLGAPLGAPVVRLARLSASLRGRRPLWWPFLQALPLVVALYLSDAIGEAAGYLFGAGNAEQQTEWGELATDRGSPG